MSSFLAPASVAALKRHFSSNDQTAYARVALQALRQGRSGDLEALIASHPLGDDWSDFHHTAMRAYLECRRGEVYLLAHPTIGGLYKIGQTGKSAEARLKSLHSAGVVGEFVLIKSWPVLDRFHVESLIHRRLEARHRHKEFFEGTWQELSGAIEEEVLAESQLLERLKESLETGPAAESVNGSLSFASVL